MNKMDLNKLFVRVSHKREDTEQEGWMVAYADMITLLFIFFTLLLSISTLNQTKLDIIRSQVSAKKSTTSLKAISETFKSELEKRNLQDQVTVDLNSEGLRISFSEQVFFATAAAQINPSGQEVLAKVAAVLKNMDGHYMVAIEGHTDSVPIKTKEFASNWSLSSARSVNVLHSLAALGVNDRQMSIRAFADTRPVEKAEASLAKNRRVSLLIY